MKNLASFLTLSTALCTSAFAATSSPVMHVLLKPTPHTISMTINNMPVISNIYDVGNTAFAVDKEDNLVAFFNGTQWSAGVNPTGSNSIGSFQPAYPLTGKTSEAWLNDQNDVYHFDGTQWQHYASLGKLLGITDMTHWQVQLASAGGSVFLLGYQSDDRTNQATPIRYTVYNPVSKQWYPPVAINNWNTDFESTLFIAYDANHPHAIFQVTPSDSPQQADLMQINADGTHEIVQPTSPANFQNGISFMTSGAMAFDVDTPDDMLHHFYYNLTPSADTWSGNTAPGSGTQDGFDDLPDDSNVSNGLVCMDYPGPQNFQVSCINMNNTSPQWTPLTKLSPAFDYENDGFTLTTVNHGFWLGYKATHTSPADLVYYDADTSTVKDTHFPYATSSQYALVRPIADGQVLACVMDDPDSNAATPVSLYTYDTTAAQPTWQKIATTNLDVNMCMMSSNGGDQYLKTPARDFWLSNVAFNSSKTALTKADLLKLHIHK